MTRLTLSEIEATDRQIDQLVYELYGLSEDEIRTVENQVAKPKAAAPTRSTEDAEWLTQQQSQE